MIDSAAAIDIARRRAAEKGWPFAEPLGVVERKGWRGGLLRFEILTHADGLGGKSRFVIDAKTGAIISEGFLPR